jgi:hypothetical protein
MFLCPGEVATKITRLQLAGMRAPETRGTTLAKGKLERSVGKRTGGYQGA